MSVNFNGMPSELTERPRWVLWRGAKIPYRAISPRITASCVDPDTWGDFNTIRKVYTPSRDAGVGFVLDAKDGLVCIDIDHNVGARALSLLREVGCSYIERSPSGNGLHGWGMYSGDLPRKKGRYQGLDVEIYQDRRYMTVTGDVIDGGPFKAILGVNDLCADLQKRTEEHRRPTEGNGRAQRTTEVIFSNPLCSSVGKFLPETGGQRNKRLFEMARYLKGMNPDAGKEELRAVVKEWHRLALPVISTKEFSITWADFLRGWDKVKFPHGATLDAVLSGVWGDSIPGGLDCLGYGDQAVLLTKVCRRLAAHHGRAPFFLSARQAGQLIQAHFTDAAKMLNALVADDVLELVERGTGKMASRYRWIWPDAGFLSVDSASSAASEVDLSTSSS